VLGSAGSRLDTICGIVNDPTPADRPSNSHEIGRKVGTEPSLTSAPSSAAVSDITILPVGVIDTPMSDTSVMAATASKSTLTSHPQPHQEIQHSVAIHSRRNASMIPSAPLESTLRGSEPNSKEQAVNQGLLTRKRGMALGVIFALLLAVIDVFFAEYWVQALTAFVGLELLMWNRISELNNSSSLLQQVLLPKDLMSSSKDSPAKSSLGQVISVGKACFYTGQDWLIAQFFVAIFYAVS